MKPTVDAKAVWEGLVVPKFRARPEFAFVPNDPALPNVLIYGDSISMGYTPTVRENLAGKANVYRIHTNGADSASFIPLMTAMHEAMRDESIAGRWAFAWDVIHFNVGLHDLKRLRDGIMDAEHGTLVCSIEQYERNLECILAYLAQTTPDTLLIWATTTPVPAGGVGRIAGDALKYNEAAERVFRRERPEIAVNDLYAFTKPHQSAWWMRPGNVHFTPEGQKAQGDEVTRYILHALSAGDVD